MRFTPGGACCPCCPCKGHLSDWPTLYAAVNFPCANLNATYALVPQAAGDTQAGRTITVLDPSFRQITLPQPDDCLYYGLDGGDSQNYVHCGNCQSLYVEVKRVAGSSSFRLAAWLSSGFGAGDCGCEPYTVGYADQVFTCQGVIDAVFYVQKQGTSFPNDPGLQQTYDCCPGVAIGDYVGSIHITE